MQESQCRACASSILIVLPDDRKAKGIALSERKQVSLERNGLDVYVRCPYCSAKNIAAVRTARDGKRTIELIRAVIDDI